ncbi:MAG: hypothetical protein Fur0037_07600 [Planctomycetota bacterium]
MRLLTPRGRGGVAVLALEGDSEIASLERWVGPLSLSDRRAAEGSIRRRRLRLPSGVADDALLVGGPSGLELHLHGSEAVIRAIEERLGPFSAREPTPAEALLRSAISLPQLALAMEQMALPLEEFAASLPDAGPERAAELAAARERSRAAMAHCRPCRLVIAGRQNAGKSTLLNRLLAQERVLAGPEPGLTRDPVREVAELAGYPYELIDTAGEGEPALAIDLRAQRLGRKEREGALVLWLVDSSRGLDPAERAEALRADLVVASKADLPQAPWPEGVPLALRVTREADPAFLRHALGEALRSLRSLPPAGPVGGAAALDAAQMALLENLS